MKIIYLGSTDFSLPILPRIKDGYELAGLIIVNPKPSGRGLKTSIPGTAVWAEENVVKVFAPEKPNDPAFISEMGALKPDLFVLCAYGHILTGEFLRTARLGGINIHPSLLPKYRGAAPIQRAIMNDEKTTGLTIFFMDEKIDHGDIVFRKELSIDESDDFGTLCGKLTAMAAAEIGAILDAIAAGNYRRMPQMDQEKSSAPKIRKEETVIDWQQPARRIFNLIRALEPGPGARTVFRGKELTVVKSSVTAAPFLDDRPLKPGEMRVYNRNLYIGTGDLPLIIRELKPENKRRMTGLDFINGFRIKEGDTIE